jgi:hypothetical protein
MTRTPALALLCAASLTALALSAPAAAEPIGCDVRPLTGAGSTTRDAITPDGGTVVYASTGSGVHVHDVATATSDQLAPAGANAMLADGGATVFYEGPGGVRAVDIDGSDDRLIAGPGPATHVRLLDVASDAEAALVERTTQGIGQGVLLWDGASLSPLPGPTVSFLMGGQLSDDGELAGLVLLHRDEAGHGYPYLALWDPDEEQYEEVAGGVDVDLRGSTPTAWYSTGAGSPVGVITSTVRSVELDGASESVLQGTSAFLLDVSHDQGQLLLDEIFPPWPDPAFAQRTVRQEVGSERRIPFGVLLGGEHVRRIQVGAIADDGTTLAFEDPDGRVAVAECSSFADVRPSQAFAEDIEWIFAEGITTGYEDATYRPSDTVSRQAMAAFLHRLSGDPDPAPPAEAPFADVSLAHPFLLDITWAVEGGIATGYADDTFRPSAPVTRQAMGAFLHRIGGDGLPPAGGPTFTDVSPTHPFYEDIEWMAAYDVSTGYQPGPTYRPDALVTRQAMAAFLHRVALVPHP